MRAASGEADRKGLGRGRRRAFAAAEPLLPATRPPFAGRGAASPACPRWPDRRDAAPCPRRRGGARSSRRRSTRRRKGKEAGRTGSRGSGRRPTSCACCTARPASAEQVQALDTYLVTVADHGLNASTFAARVIASTRAGLLSRWSARSARSRARCTAARPARSSTCSTPSGSGRCRRLARGRAGARRAPDGLRPPRLSRPRPARRCAQGDGRRAQGRANRIAFAETVEAAGPARSSRENKPGAASTPTSSSTRPSCSKRSALRATASPTSSRPAAWRAGPPMCSNRRRPAGSSGHSRAIRGRRREAGRCRGGERRRGEAPSSGPGCPVGRMRLVVGCRPPPQFSTNAPPLALLERLGAAPGVILLDEGEFLGVRAMRGEAAFRERRDFEGRGASGRTTASQRNQRRAAPAGERTAA